MLVWCCCPQKIKIYGQWLPQIIVRWFSEWTAKVVSSRSCMMHRTVTTTSQLSIYVLCIVLLLQAKLIHSVFCYRCYLTNHPASSGPKECFIPLWLDMIWAYLGQTQPPAKRTCLWYCLSLSWCPKHLAFFYLICSHGLCQTEDGFVWTSDLQQCPGHVWMGTQCPGPRSSGDLRRPQETSGSTGRFRLHWTGKSYTDCIAIVMEEYSIYIYAYSLVCLIIFMIIYACYMYEYIYIINI